MLLFCSFFVIVNYLVTFLYFFYIYFILLIFSLRTYSFIHLIYRSYLSCLSDNSDSLVVLSLLRGRPFCRYQDIKVKWVVYPRINCCGSQRTLPRPGIRTRISQRRSQQLYHEATALVPRHNQSYWLLSINYQNRLVSKRVIGWGGEGVNRTNLQLCRFCYTNLLDKKYIYLSISSTYDFIMHEIRG